MVGPVREHTQYRYDASMERSWTAFNLDAEPLLRLLSLEPHKEAQFAPPERRSALLLSPLPPPPPHPRAVLTLLHYSPLTPTAEGRPQARLRA